MAGTKGKSGRRPTPTATLKLHNSKRAKYNRHDDEPEPTLGVPNCPVWLPKEAKALWKRVVPELSRMGVLAKIEREALVMYCQSWSMFVASCEVIERTGRTIRRANGDIVCNPEIKIMNDARLSVLRFGQEFGLTPASRTRVHAKPQEQPTSGVAKFLG